MTTQNKTITYNNHSFEANTSNDGTLEIAGNPYKIKILAEKAGGVYILTINDKVYTVRVANFNRSSIEIEANGENLNFDVIGKLEQVLSVYNHAKSAGKEKVAQIKSPMPGLVVKINCELGQEVKKGDKVLVIEAMKMENALASPIDGIVSKIEAEIGKAVEKDALLLEIKSN